MKFRNRDLFFFSSVPPQPDKNYIKSITLNPKKIQRTPTSFEILLPLFPDTNGDVQYYAILVSRLGFSKEQRSVRFNMKNGDWPHVSSWRESMEKDFKLPYQASEPRWTPYRKSRLCECVLDGLIIFLYGF